MQEGLTFSRYDPLAQHVLQSDYDFFPPKLEVDRQLPSFTESLICFGRPHERDRVY